AGVDAYIAEYWQYIDEDKLDFDVRTFFEENSITFFLMDENPREQDRFQLNGMSNHLGISAMGVEKIEMEGGSMNFIVRSSGSKKDVIDARTSGLEAFNSIMFALEAILISQIRPQLQIAIDQSGENTPFTEAMQLELIIPRHQNQEVFNDT